MAKPKGFKTSAEIPTRAETLRGPHSPEAGTMYMPSSMLPEKVFRSEVTNKKREQQQKKLHWGWTFNTTWKMRQLSIIEMFFYADVVISMMKTRLWKNIYSCQNKDYKGIAVKIIMSENDPANLRLYEAFYIRKCMPTLNSREECSEFADLLIWYFIL